MLALCLASTAFYGPPAAFQQQRMASPLAREKPVQLATSIKGTPIWDLRVATPEDVPTIVGMSDGLYPSELVSLCVSNGNCVVGESGVNVISAALVHTTGKTSSDLLAILERPDMPAEVADEDRARDDKAKLALVEKLGLAKAGAGGDKIISFVANLASMNPDPRMKMK
ncbi:hypothetical protein Ctob_006705 [Chrysochromulina tobinii]|uniref:Uncharacterized protein n=1 Tax=Chrysochromulina tobinii TaxID=1460289 RepID=A0A0M0J4B1_9EUKA|nr:hypothetical protein Ctob_006705 [Chrysochromulina tobinii]|eukprot:KOO21325.1 hypothetical protein Ctob_006705 [Chrysochromulina sp. CCMP291]